jgi:hypothetical protein
MLEFISGAIFMACLTVALFFMRFFAKTRDRFFLLFATAFCILAFERFIVVYNAIASEGQSLVYAIRLTAFALILIAVFDKNRTNETSGEE